MRRVLEWLQYTGPGRHAAWAGVTVVLVLAWLGLEQLSAQLWFLPAGLRLASLWVVPTRRWIARSCKRVYCRKRWATISACS